MKQEQAETIALQAITYISSQENYLISMMNQCGLTPQDLKNNLSDSSFLSGVLDFLLSNEEILIQFLQEIECEPEFVIRARMAFPGAQNLWGD